MKNLADLADLADMCPTMIIISVLSLKKLFFGLKKPELDWKIVPTSLFWRF